MGATAEEGPRGAGCGGATRVPAGVKRGGGGGGTKKAVVGVLAVGPTIYKEDQ